MAWLNWLKRNWLIVTAVAIALLLWLWKKRAIVTNTIVQDSQGYPNEDRPTAHFSWQELLKDAYEQDNKTGEQLYPTQASLTPFQKDFVVSVARFAELIRTLNFQKPLYCHILFLPQDDTDDYSVEIIAANGQKQSELDKPVQDAVANLSDFQHAVTFQIIGGKTHVQGNAGELIKAIASGAAQV